MYVDFSGPPSRYSRHFLLAACFKRLRSGGEERLPCGDKKIRPARPAQILIAGDVP
jgi:hypothetical protein